MTQLEFYNQLERVYWSINSTASKPSIRYYLKLEGFSESEIKTLML